MKQILVVPYNPEWPSLFEKEAKQIKQALGDSLLAIHHIGSTSIPKLAAKPIIDCLLVVKNTHASIPILEKAGYAHKGEFNIPFRPYFSTPSVHLHVFEEGNSEIERHLLFREYVRTHPEIRKEYEHLKYSLLQDPACSEKNNAMFTGYARGKEPFIQSILTKAGYTGIRMLHCTQDHEWKTVQTLCKQYAPYHPTPDSSTPYFTTSGQVHFILSEGSEGVGYCHLQLFPNHQAFLHLLIVTPAAQTKGLDIYLLEQAEKWLIYHGYTSLYTLFIPKEASFYLAQGYTELPFGNEKKYAGHKQPKYLGKIF